MTTTDKPSAGAKTIADKLMALRSALNPTKHQFVWDEMTTLADDINRLTVMPEKLSPPVAGAEVGMETVTLTVTDLVNTRDKIIQECVTAALEQRCERFTEWDLACTTLADRLRALSSASTPVAERGGGGARLPSREKIAARLKQNGLTSRDGTYLSASTFAVIDAVLALVIPTPETGDGSETSTTHTCPCGTGEEPCPGSDGKPLCARPDHPAHPSDTRPERGEGTQ